MNLKLAQLFLTSIIFYTSLQAHAADTTVNSVALTFSPADITIDMGDTVTWTDLQAGGGHNVAQTDSATGMVHLMGGFRSGDQGDVDTWQYTFNTPGVFYYICEPHIAFDMRGSVTVLGPPAPASNMVSILLTCVLLTSVAAILLYRRGPRTQKVRFKGRNS